MKEATGELNMTVITLVAISAIAAFFYFFVWPAIKTGIAMNTCKSICPGGEAKSVDVESKQCVCANNDVIPFGD